MLKNIFMFATVLCTFLQASYSASSDFNPEMAEFSKKKTLKTWVAEKHHDGLDAIQSNVAIFVRENPASLTYFENVPVGAKVLCAHRYINFPSIELAFLQYVSLVSQTVSPITLEIAGGIGGFSWKVPYAFAGAGRHILNDMNGYALQQAQEVVFDKFLLPESQKMVELDQGDCFDILKRQPELRGKVNAIFIKNFEHLLNPAQHQQLLALVSELLADGGQAFFCCQSFAFEVKETDPLFGLWRKQKAMGDIYPGFCRYKTSYLCLDNASFAVDGTFKNIGVSRPDDDAEMTCSAPELVETGYMVISPVTNKLAPLLRYTQTVTYNNFSPAVYRNAVGKNPSLAIVDTFFVDNSGDRAEKFTGPGGYVQRRLLVKSQLSKMLRQKKE